MACMDIINRSRSMLKTSRAFRDGEDMIRASAPELLRQNRPPSNDEHFNSAQNEPHPPVAHKRPPADNQKIEQLCRKLMENPSRYRDDEPMIDISKLPEVVGNKRQRTESNSRSVKKPRKSATSGIQNAIEECRDLFGDPEARNDPVPQSRSPTNNLVSPRDAKRTAKSTAKRVRNGSTPLKRPPSARDDASTPRDLSPDVCTPMNNFSPNAAKPLRSKAPQTKPKTDAKVSSRKESSLESTSDSSLRVGNGSSHSAKPARTTSSTPLRSKKEVVKSERKRDSGKEISKDRASDSSTAAEQVSPPRKNPLRSRVVLAPKAEPKDEIMVDVKRESNRTPSRDAKRESMKDADAELKRDSKSEREVKRESKRDSKREAKRDSKRDSRRDSKRDSKKESRRESRKEDEKWDEPSKHDNERESSRRDEAEREKYRRDESDRERHRSRDRDRGRERDRDRERESSKREKSRRDEYSRDESRRERSRRDDSRREDSRRERSSRDESRRERFGRDESRRGDSMIVEPRRSDSRREESRRDETKRDERRESSRDEGRRDDSRRDDERRERTRKEESRRDEYGRKEGHRDEMRRDERRRSEPRREESRREDSRRESRKESKTEDKMEVVGESKTEDRTTAKGSLSSKGGHTLAPSVASIGKSTTSVPLSKPAPPPLRSSSVAIPTSRPVGSGTGSTMPRFKSKPLPLANGTGNTGVKESPVKKKTVNDYLTDYNQYKKKAAEYLKEKNYDEYEKYAMKVCNTCFEWGLCREKEFRKQENDIRNSQQLRDKVMKELRDHYEFCKKRTRDHIQILEDIKRTEPAAVLKRQIFKANLRVSMLTAQWVLPQARTLQTMSSALARVEAASETNSDRGAPSSDSRLTNQEVRTMQKVLSEYTNVVEIYNRVVTSNGSAEVQEPGTECNIQ